MPRNFMFMASVYNIYSPNHASIAVNIIHATASPKATHRSWRDPAKKHPPRRIMPRHHANLFGVAGFQIGG